MSENTTTSRRARAGQRPARTRPQQGGSGGDKPRERWGRRSAQFYHDLRDKEVSVAVTTGKAFRGVLIGVDAYNLIIRQSSGLELLIHKGAVVYVAPKPQKAV